MMRIALSAGISLAALLFAGCGSSQPPAEQTPAPAQPGHTAPSHPVVPQAGVYWNPVTQRPEEKPSGIVLTPADAGDILVDITWDSWTKQGARGKAVRATKDCVPDCATGGTTRRDVMLVFQGSQPLPDTSGLEQYTTLIITDRDGNSETVNMAAAAR